MKRRPMACNSCGKSAVGNRGGQRIGIDPGCLFAEAFEGSQSVAQNAGHNPEGGAEEKNRTADSQASELDQGFVKRFAISRNNELNFDGAVHPAGLFRFE